LYFGKFELVNPQLALEYFCVQPNKYLAIWRQELDDFVCQREKRLWELEKLPANLRQLSALKILESLALMAQRIITFLKLNL
jgi:hypothetical protein